MGLIKSDPILTSSVAYVKRQMDGAHGGVLAIVRGMEASIDCTGFDSILQCQNAAECIQAVRRGDADVAAGDRSVMEYYIYDTHSSLTTSQIAGEMHSVCVAVSRARRDDLFGVLNRYVSSLSDLTKTAYLEAGNAHGHAESLTHYIAMHPLQVTAVITFIVVLLAAVCFVLLYSIRMNRKNRELFAANEARSLFLSRMSHDIRTPMNGIIGMVNIAEQHADDPAAVRRCLAKIQTTSEYLLSLLSDVLDMRKLETEQIRLSEDSVSLQEMLSSCAYMLENRAAENGVTLDVTALSAFQPPRVITSEQHLQRVFMNVLGNAVKYNKQGGTVHIAARVTAQTDVSVTCAFYIADTGVGISPSFQKHMFEPFTQENSASRSNYQGTGLGLSIVKAIMDKMGGSITVDSTPGLGTTVTLTLPFRIDKTYRPAAEPSVRAEYLSGRTVLAAEDNQLNAEILHAVLMQAGAQVVLVGDGAQLVERFAQSSPGEFDLILTDVMMPVMDGYEAARRIRALDRPDAKHIPIIALTANAFAEDAEQAQSAGMDAHLTKPIDLDKLAQTVERLLG